MKKHYTKQFPFIIIFLMLTNYSSAQYYSSRVVWYCAESSGNSGSCNVQGMHVTYTRHEQDPNASRTVSDIRGKLEGPSNSREKDPSGGGASTNNNNSSSDFVIDKIAQQLFKALIKQLMNATKLLAPLSGPTGVVISLVWPSELGDPELNSLRQSNHGLFNNKIERIKAKDYLEDVKLKQYTIKDFMKYTNILNSKVAFNIVDFKFDPQSNQYILDLKLVPYKQTTTRGENGYDSYRRGNSSGNNVRYIEP